jgi:hypothetical protein
MARMGIEVKKDNFIITEIVRRKNASVSMSGMYSCKNCQFWHV